MAELPPAPRVYSISRYSLSRCYEIAPISSPNQPIASAAISSLKGPDLTLHASPDHSGPIIAVLDKSTFSSTMKVCLGDPKAAAPDAVQYSKLEKSGWSDREYQIPVILEKGQQPRTFSWRRTRHEAAAGTSVNQLSSKNYKLVDEQGATLAVFTRESMAWNKVGTLDVRVDLGLLFEHLVWITILGVYEKLRRDSHKG
ncbi:hypothetical protein NLU13_6846 [Sarocladium strictum]|uniref:Uncharacterized protein n=1 Tax=Sarocladium strictum TaxID=5046 RepID=A0AA39L6I3_SARSR|nr:hypothetical protein NLU13_6846 [Sarocladium strictum]